MPTHKQFLTIGAAVGALLLLLAQCAKNTEPMPSKPLALEPGDTLHVAIRHSAIEIATNTGDDLVLSSPIRHADIVVKDSGEIVVTKKTWGPTFEPAIGLGVIGKPAAMIDLQVFFVGRFGLTVGGGYIFHKPLYDAIKPYVAVSYDLPFHFTPNTSLFAGVSGEGLTVVPPYIKTVLPVAGIKVRL